ncbi:sulfotransferase family protein [Sulfitobacter aestuarii]|uniref:Sulfotransferase family protein n=1 Tax=Sulfitobacter aestuarii TaxID=2161676 RepID=A0ABW5U4P9_9RHOB
MGQPNYVFVAGLHRSGTSLLASLIAQHPDVAAICDAPVPEQEGVFLQGAIPHTALHGVPGEFAHDPTQHLTETSRFNNLETSERLNRDWALWFETGRPWRLEKSPVNLLRSRLYQQLFPMAHFIFVVRHPLAVSRATVKWNAKGEAALLQHWQAAHRIMAEDLRYLHCALVLRYEDLCAAPRREMDRIAAFLDLHPGPLRQGLDRVTDGNAQYLTRPPETALPEVAARLGYGNDGIAGPPAAEFCCRHVLRSVRESVDR